MLLDGVNHVALVTEDAEAVCAFYVEVFDAEVGPRLAMGPDGGTLAFVKIGPHSELNVFEVPAGDHDHREAEMFTRGRVDHVGLQAASLEAFEEIRDRLLARGATDGFVTDFGPVLSVWFRGPDRVEGEVCVANPDAEPGAMNPPGTPSLRYHPTGAVQAREGVTGS